ncbi:MAG: hypothetical protein KDB23_25460, partial [Planctomycetales bacterium]|nr:hypothetical protein [Planctomycetales bacterium]
MPHTSRIKTPLKQHLHRFRLSVFPAIWFLFCVAITLYLWQRVARVGSIVGEIAAEQISVPAGADGLLVGDAKLSLKLFDEVHKGDVIAVLDDRQIKAQIGVLQAEVAKLTADLDAEQTKLENDQLSLVADHQRERVRLAWEVERRHLETLQLGADVKALQQQLQGAETTLKMLQKMADSPYVKMNPADLADRTAERNALAAQLAGKQQVGKVAYSQWQDAIKQRDSYPELQSPEVEAILAPIRAAITVQERKMEELQLLQQQLVITSPIDGVITEVFKVPGQQVIAGDPIVSI